MTFIKWFALLIVALAASTAGAQQYPARAIRLVVGFRTDLHSPRSKEARISCSNSLSPFMSLVSR